MSVSPQQQQATVEMLQAREEQLMALLHKWECEAAELRVRLAQFRFELDGVRTPDGLWPFLDKENES